MTDAEVTEEAWTTIYRMVWRLDAEDRLEFYDDLLGSLRPVLERLTEEGRQAIEAHFFRKLGVMYTPPMF